MTSRTGDLSMNVQRLFDALAAVKYHLSVSHKLVTQGDPITLLRILHFILLDYSPHIAALVSDSGYSLYAKDDCGFIESVLRFVVEKLHISPHLNAKQFLSNSFAEVKVVFVTEVILKCISEHTARERLSSIRRRGPVPPYASHYTFSPNSSSTWGHIRAQTRSDPPLSPQDVLHPRVKRSTRGLPSSSHVAKSASIHSVGVLPSEPKGVPAPRVAQFLSDAIAVGLGASASHIQRRKQALYDSNVSVPVALAAAVPSIIGSVDARGSSSDADGRPNPINTQVLREYYDKSVSNLVMGLNKGLIHSENHKTHGDNKVPISQPNEKGEAAVLARLPFEPQIPSVDPRLGNVRTGTDSEDSGNSAAKGEESSFINAADIAAVNSGVSFAEGKLHRAATPRAQALESVLKSESSRPQNSQNDPKKEKEVVDKIGAITGWPLCPVAYPVTLPLAASVHLPVPVQLPARPAVTPSYTVPNAARTFPSTPLEHFTHQNTTSSTSAPSTTVRSSIGNVTAPPEDTLQSTGNPVDISIQSFASTNAKAATSAAPGDTSLASLLSASSEMSANFVATTNSILNQLDQLGHRMQLLEGRRSALEAATRERKEARDQEDRKLAAEESLSELQRFNKGKEAVIYGPNAGQQPPPQESLKKTFLASEKAQQTLSNPGMQRYTMASVPVSSSEENAEIDRLIRRFAAADDLVARAGSTLSV